VHQYEHALKQRKAAQWQVRVHTVAVTLHLSASTVRRLLHSQHAHGGVYKTGPAWLCIQ